MVAHYPLADTFKLQSRPTATKTIYLNFTGHVTTGTYWNDSGDITTKPYSFEGDATFSNNELNQIQEIWDRVSECFSPFDVNVTTQEPPASDLVNSGGSDTRWGIRVCIGESNPSPAPGAGGVAYVGSFSWSTDTPCFVFESGPGVYGKYIADATVHEVGHTLDLEHDGRISPPEEYYEGHGSGPTGWAPHMGVSYYRNLVQWSKGEYLSANNTEDDLAIISTHNGFGYRPDDFASSQGTAADIGGAAAGSVFNVRQNGVIEQRTDSDWFKITAAAGALNLNAVGGPRNTMLDIKLDLYDANGSLLVSNNPTADVVASISYTVPTGGGTYYVKIDGTGVGDPLATGYTDYSSLGQYRITGTYTTDGNPPPTNDVVSPYKLETEHDMQRTHGKNCSISARKCETASSSDLIVAGASRKPALRPCNSAW